MAMRPTKFTSAFAMAAALSLTATPAAAAELPAIAYGGAEYELYDEGEANQYRHRRYRDYRHHRRGGVDAGDVIAGVAVLGALAAIIGTSRSRDRDRERYEDRYPRRDRARYDDRRGVADTRGIERAVDMCIDAVDRDSGRVEAVDNARRSASGWDVSGTLESGDRFSCRIGNDGRIRSIDVDTDDFAYNGATGTDLGARGEQYSADYYARARATTRTPADGPYQYGDGAGYRDDGYAARDERYDMPQDDGPQPSYPGGPLEGEDDDRPEWQGDGRYDTASAPDFRQ
ncbi:hypothetical protein [Aurantiacibacter gangjinensis]|uniref:hypothetical protein n=1 Tax=Aurantiacibacter gangjinensis TaxID=502682 RepID=UPI00069C1CBC|nr:hypothetical protein [Aurantiacibacter gangjinensis]APE28348.1 hypothetical protein BMF35_a1519 [Aurantiacibacter gangjinensis]